MNGLDRDTFIKKNEGLVIEAAKKFLFRINNYPHIDFDDLVQTGYIGLIKAYDNFKPEYGTQFSTYAVPMIEGEIRRFLIDNLELLKYSRQAKLDFNHIYKAGLIDEEPEMIASQLNIPIERVENALAYYRSRCPDSIQLIIHDDDSTPLTLEDKLGEEVDFDSNLELEFFLNKLDERTRKIVEMRLQGMGQVEIGKRIGISQVQVSRILRRLKKQFKEGGEIKMVKESLKVEQKAVGKPIIETIEKEQPKVVAEKKKPDYAKAKELAEKTTLTAKEIQRQTGISYPTALKYVHEYRQVDKKQMDKQQVVEPAINRRLDAPEINKKLDTKEVKPTNVNANGYVTMTLKMSMLEAPERLNDVLKALRTLGFEDINITIESQKNRIGGKKNES